MEMSTRGIGRVSIGASIETFAQQFPRVCTVTREKAAVTWKLRHGKREGESESGKSKAKNHKETWEARRPPEKKQYFHVIDW